MKRDKLKNLSAHELKEKEANCFKEFLSLSIDPDSRRKLRLMANLEKNIHQLRFELEERKRNEHT